jgi:hypothetical protein
VTRFLHIRDVSLNNLLGQHRKSLKYEWRMRIFYIIVSLLVFGLNSSSLHSEETPKNEPNAKDIPKPVLMLGLFCNSALVAIKGDFQTNPRALPWKADGIREKKIAEIFNKLDAKNSGYIKSVNDKALTEGEAHFLHFNADHEARDWVRNVNRICANPAMGSYEYEQCLKEVNSEIYKCYRQVMDQIK